MMRFTELSAGFSSSGYQRLCDELSMFCDDINGSYMGLKRKQAGMIKELIRQAIQAGIIYHDLDDEIVYHYICMGMRYFETDIEYRGKMMRDTNFRGGFLQLLWRNIFTDSASFVYEGTQENETQS